MELTTTPPREGAFVFQPMGIGWGEEGIYPLGGLVKTLVDLSAHTTSGIVCEFVLPGFDCACRHPIISKFADLLLHQRIIYN